MVNMKILLSLSLSLIFSVVIFAQVPNGRRYNPNLPNGTTATTQLAGDNTTKIATDAFVLQNVSPLGPNAYYAVDYGVVPDAVIAYNVTCSNGSHTIATGTNDPPFTAGDVGKVIAGVSAIGTTANCPPQTTITGYTDAHHVTVSLAATTGTSTGSAVWGTQDETSNLQAAFAASLGVGCLYLPTGGMLISGAPFLDQRSGSATGYPPCIIGQGNSVLYLLPTFDFGTCVTNGACIFTWDSGDGNLNPNYALLRDFMVQSPGYTLTGTGTDNTWFYFNRVTMVNIWAWNLGYGAGTCMTFNGPVSAYSPICYISSNVGFFVEGNGATSAGLNQLVTIDQGYAQGDTNGMDIGPTASLQTFGLQYQGVSGPVVSNQGGIWNSWGEGFFAPASTNDTIRNAGVTHMTGDQVVGHSANIYGALDCNASGADLTFDNGTIDGGGTGGYALRSVSGCNLKIRFPVTVTNYAAALAGNNVSDPSETQPGTCSSNAATVTFSLVYKVAPLVVVSDTTSASTGAQATSANTTTATIHCNGASDTFVATVIPNPI
jgi:hypothetical protein